MDLGLGLTARWGKYRPTVQVAANRTGFGLGYCPRFTGNWFSRICTVLDVTIGANYLWDLRDGQQAWGVYASLFKF